MRWTERFLKRLVLSQPQASSSEQSPAATASAPAIALEAPIAGALCVRCRREIRALSRNPHRVRAGRARARNARRDERGRFLARLMMERKPETGDDSRQ